MSWEGGWRDGGRRLAAPLVPALARLYRAYYRTLRLRGLGETGASFDPRSFAFAGEIFALCERDALALAGLVAARGFTALVALGRDGDWAAAALGALGCEVVRGSSRRGGWAALRQLLARLRTAPGPLAMIVDGPLGPSGRVRPGALVCGRESGRPIRPVAAAARHRLRFPGTWSGIYLPLPFAEVRIALAPPLVVPAAAGVEELDTLAAEVERRLAGALTGAQAGVQAGAAGGGFG
jgi:lysophospholipid acyltransferase (LPLAT)-like uncharacterized protein